MLLAIVFGFCGSMMSDALVNRRDDRIAAGGLGGIDLRLVVFDQAELDEFFVSLVNLRQDRAAGRRHDRMLRQSPAELFSNLEPVRF